MITVKSFTFSPFSENTYVLYDHTKAGVIIDPGCLSQSEKETLKAFVEDNEIKIEALLQTHAHLDHVFGSAYVKRTFGVKMWMHKNEIPILKDVENRCNTWGIPGYEPVEADSYLDDLKSFEFGESKLEIRFVPGHAPGHVAFVSHEDKFIVGGDCLFYQSIGRTDFPLCDHAALINSIKTQFFTLSDDYVVYAGHMQATNIGFEKAHNPFIH